MDWVHALNLELNSRTDLHHARTQASHSPSLSGDGVEGIDIVVDVFDVLSRCVEAVGVVAAVERVRDRQAQRENTRHVRAGGGPRGMGYVSRFRIS